jgi:EmrB/QacA subfamily drug resistance transporter
MTMTDASARGPNRVVTYLVAGAFFMELLDGTVIATALPKMGATFHVGAVAMNIGMTAYLLAVAVFTPISGWVADRFGARTVFAGALLGFTLASVLCGVSQTLGMFTAARALQGAAGAAMAPVGRLIVLRTTDKANLMQAIATIVWPGLVAPVLGPPVGGFLVAYASWRWIFFLNLPMGVAAALVTVLLVPNLRSPDRRNLDWVGFVLSGASLVGVVYGLTVLGRPASAGQGAIIFAAGLLVGWLAILHFLRHPTPLLDFRALKQPTFSLGIYSGSMQRVALGAIPFLTPLLFQIVFGMNAFQSGALLLWIFAGNLLMKLFTTPILRRFGFRRVLIANGLLAAASVFALALLTPATPTWMAAALLFCGGLFRSMQFTSLSTIQFADVAPPDMTSANTLASLVAQMTLGLGVVFGALALEVSALVTKGAGSAPRLADFHLAFVAVGALMLASLIECLKLQKTAGESVSGHRASA